MEHNNQAHAGIVLACDPSAATLPLAALAATAARIALGPRAGQKAFTLRSLPGTPLLQPSKPFLASADRFSLHAGVAAGADERQKVERLCGYIARPAIATGRLSLTAPGQVRYTLANTSRQLEQQPVAWASQHGSSANLRTMTGLSTYRCRAAAATVESTFPRPQSGACCGLPVLPI